MPLSTYCTLRGRITVRTADMTVHPVRRRPVAKTAIRMANIGRRIPVAIPGTAAPGMATQNHRCNRQVVWSASVGDNRAARDAG